MNTQNDNIQNDNIQKDNNRYQRALCAEQSGIEEVKDLLISTS